MSKSMYTQAVTYSQKKSNNNKNKNKNFIPSTKLWLPRWRYEWWLEKVRGYDIEEGRDRERKEGKEGQREE